MDAIKKNPALYVGLAALIGLAASDWPLGVTTVWAGQHQLATALLTSLLLLALGTFAFEGAVKERQTREWAMVATIAYRALSQEAKDTRVKLRMSLDGADPRLEGATADSARVERMRAISERLELPDGMPINSRVGALLADEEWVECTLASLRDLKRHGWEVLTDWAPVMLSTGRLASDLSLVGELNDGIIRLQRLVARYREGESDATHTAITSTLQGLILQSLQLEAHLRVGAGYDAINSEMKSSAQFWGVSIESVCIGGTTGRSTG